MATQRKPRAGEPLTTRERQVLALVCEGHSNKIIADHLGIGETTAHCHVSRIIAKMGAANRTHAAVLHTREAMRLRHDPMFVGPY